MSRQLPSEIKKLRGTYRADRAPVNEPRPGAAGIRMPRGLLKVGRLYWRRLAPRLQRVRLLTDLDVEMLTQLCVCLGRLDECEQAVTDGGILVDGARGGLVRNPAVMAANAYRASALQLAARFGMSPVDRARVSMQMDDEAADPFSAYVAERDSQQWQPLPLQEGQDHDDTR